MYIFMQAILGKIHNAPFNIYILCNQIQKYTLFYGGEDKNGSDNFPRVQILWLNIQSYRKHRFP